MVVDVIREMLEERWGDVFEIAERTWVSFDSSRSWSSLLVSECPGGSFHFFAKLFVGDAAIVFRCRTVCSIFHRTTEEESFVFEYCDPSFPDNFFEFVNRSAINSLKCYKLEHQRAWNRYRREHSS